MPLLIVLALTCPGSRADEVEQSLVLEPGKETRVEVRVPLTLREAVFHILAPVGVRSQPPAVRVLQTGGPLAVEAPEVVGEARIVPNAGASGLIRVTIKLPPRDREITHVVLLDFEAETGVPIRREIILQRFASRSAPAPSPAVTQSEPIR